VAEVTDVTLPWWVVVLLAVGALGPFVALGGHGAIAWVAIKRFFARVSARISDVEERAGILQAQADVLTAKADALTARVDLVSAKIPPAPDLAKLRVDLLADLSAVVPKPPDLVAFRAELLEDLPTFDLAALRADILADMKKELEEAIVALDTSIGEKIKMGFLAKKSALTREANAVEGDIMEAADPRARGLVEALGRRRGLRAARFLESIKEIREQEEAGVSLLGDLRGKKPPA